MYGYIVSRISYDLLSSTHEMEGQHTFSIDRKSHPKDQHIYRKTVQPMELSTFNLPYCDFRKSAYVFFKPESKSVIGRHPRDRSIVESIHFLGAPSGLVASNLIFPW